MLAAHDEIASLTASSPIIDRIAGSNDETPLVEPPQEGDCEPPQERGCTHRYAGRGALSRRKGDSGGADGLWREAESRLFWLRVNQYVAAADERCRKPATCHGGRYADANAGRLRPLPICAAFGCVEAKDRTKRQNHGLQWLPD